jgi:hypothetical protein
MKKMHYWPRLISCFILRLVGVYLAVLKSLVKVGYALTLTLSRITWRGDKGQVPVLLEKDDGGGREMIAEMILSRTRVVRCIGIAGY